MKRIFSLFIAFTLVVLTTFNVSASNATEFNGSPQKLRYDIETQTVQEVEAIETSSQRTKIVFEAPDNGYSPEYSTDLLSVSPDESSRHLLGSWTAINPATAGRYRNTVYIQVTTSDGTSYRGTGFMIGPSAVATAAHVIYNTDYSGNNYATSATVMPAKADGDNPYGTASATSFIVYDAWTDDTDREYDWAIIELNKNIGDSVGWLGLRYQGSSYNGTDISINGYPGQVNGATTQIMHRTDGTISGSYTRLLRSTNTNTVGGMSGAPVYIDSSSSGYTAIAIHSCSVSASSGSKYNQFVRITQDVYNDLVDYRNIRV